MNFVVNYKPDPALMNGVSGQVFLRDVSALPAGRQGRRRPLVETVIISAKELIKIIWNKTIFQN